MPVAFHEILVTLIQDEPTSVPWMLKRVGALGSRPCTSAENRSGSVGSTGPVERRADTVVQLGYADGSTAIVICDAQNVWNQDRYFRLPGYMARAFEDYRVPVSLLMVCGTDSLARRYRHGIRMGPRSTITVEAVGPADMPELGSDDAPPNAAAAVLAAVLRKQPKHIPDPLFVSTIDRWLGSIAPGRAADYAQYLLSTIAKEPATLLEALMKTDARLYHSEYTEQLLERGRDEGAIAHSRALLLRLLESRGPVATDRRAEIAACADLARLDAWITEGLSLDQS